MLGRALRLTTARNSASRPIHPRRRRTALALVGLVWCLALCSGCHGDSDPQPTPAEPLPAVSADWVFVSESRGEGEDSIRIWMRLELIRPIGEYDAVPLTTSEWVDNRCTAHYHGPPRWDSAHTSLVLFIDVSAQDIGKAVAYTVDLDPTHALPDADGDDANNSLTVTYVVGSGRQENPELEHPAAISADG
ncbi:MAG: hypothetical protein ACOCXA_00295 [Planctomycetota bacterium]